MNEADARRWSLVEEIYNRGSVEFSTLTKNFADCQPTALSNDLRLMQRLGLIQKKSHGVYASPLAVRALVGGAESRFDQRLRERPREKRAVAAYIVGHFLRQDGLIALDAGTQVAAVATELANAPFDVHVFTASFKAAEILVSAANVRSLMVRHGEIDHSYSAIRGPVNEIERSLGVDVSVVGVSGISTTGLSTVDQAQHDYKRWLLSAPQVVVAATHDKIGKHRGVEFGILADIRGDLKIVTDNNRSELSEREVEDFQRALEALGDIVIVVDEASQVVGPQLTVWGNSTAEE